MRAVVLLLVACAGGPSGDGGQAPPDASTAPTPCVDLVANSAVSGTSCIIDVAHIPAPLLNPYDGAITGWFDGTLVERRYHRAYPAGGTRWEIGHVSLPAPTHDNGAAIVIEGSASAVLCQWAPCVVPRITWKRCYVQAFVVFDGDSNHSVDITLADINAGQAKTYDTAEGTHSHKLTISAEQFGTLKMYGNRFVAAETASIGGHHSHHVRITCNPD